MTKKLWAAFILFILLTLNTLIFGAYVAYRNYELDTDESKTRLIGIVIDSNEDPVSGVNVSISENSTITDSNGKFSIDDVDVGIIKIELYKAGYVPIEITWLAYPLSDIENIEDSLNNITSYDSNDGIILFNEMETIEYDDLPNRSGLDLIIDTTSWPSIEGRTIVIGNSSEYMTEFNITSGVNEIPLSGNGNILIRSEDETKNTMWQQIPGTEVDITWMVLESLDIRFDQRPEKIGLKISPIYSGSRDDLEILIAVVDPIEGEFFLERKYSELLIDGTVDVYPGNVSIRVSSREVRDIEYNNIFVDEGKNLSMDINIVETGPDKQYEGMNLDWNYIFAAFYLLVAILFAFGAYKILNGMKWTIPFIIALLGFLVRGVDLIPVSLNLIFATVIIIILFTSRQEFGRREEESLKEP